MEKEVKKSCENCGYFVQHYLKYVTEYKAANCGHCINRNGKNKGKRRRPYSICEYWEEAIPITKEEREQSIKKAVESMRQRLDELGLMLKENEED